MTENVSKTQRKRPLAGAAAKGAGPGRPRGLQNKTTRTLKEAILLAAEEVGEDGEGSGALVGYLRRVARDDVKAFSGLLGKVLPLQVTGPNGGPVTTVSLTLAEYERIAAEVAART